MTIAKRKELEERFWAWRCEHGTFKGLDEMTKKERHRWENRQNYYSPKTFKEVKEALKWLREKAIRTGHGANGKLFKKYSKRELRLVKQLNAYVML